MRKQPLEFRKEEVSYVMKRWQAAESCALIGVGSVGKTNLLQHLIDPDGTPTPTELALGIKTIAARFNSGS